MPPHPSGTLPTAWRSVSWNVRRRFFVCRNDVIVLDTVTEGFWVIVAGCQRRPKKLIS